MALRVQRRAGSCVSCLACNNELAVVAAGLLSGNVVAYAVCEASFTSLFSCTTDAETVLDVQFDPDSPNLLFAAGASGMVAAWDVRAKSRAMRFPAGKEEVLCVARQPRGSLLAAGTNGIVRFWDVRSHDDTAKKRGISAFKETHMDEVSKVAFHPDQPTTFLSASTDGLVAVFDFSETLDEDASFQAAVNLNNSAGSFGFFGQERERLWCRSHTEALYLWEWRAACSEDVEGGAGPYSSCTDARGPLTAAAASSTSAPVTHLLDCAYDAAADELRAVAGTGGGDVVVSPLGLDSSGGCVFGECTGSLRGGHTKRVRCVAWPSSGRLAAVTGGEDGQLVGWESEVDGVTEMES